MPNFFSGGTGFHRHGKRNSMPRNVILEFLAENADKHFSAKEIYENLLKRNIYIGIASVYRNVELLSQLGYIKKYNFNDGSFRYQYAGKEASHHHLINLKTNEIIDIEIDEKTRETLEKFKKELEEKYNIKIKDYEIKFFGE